MSSLWTPSGEHFPDKEDGAPNQPPPPPSGSAPPSGDEPITEAAQAEIDAMRRQLAEVTGRSGGSQPLLRPLRAGSGLFVPGAPMLFQARLAIDALGSLLDGLSGRLGEAEPPLLDALSQLRLAFVQLEGAERAAAESAASSEER